MHNKTITIMLIALIFIIGASYFGIKNYIFEKEDMIGKMEKMNQLIEKEDWKEAEVLNKELEKIWENHENWIQVNSAEQDYADFKNHLNSIEAGIKAKDIATALSSVRNLKDTWKTLNEVVPEP